MEYQSPFHSELLSYLLQDVERHMQEGGLTLEKEWIHYKKALQTAIYGKSSTPVTDLLEQYHRLFSHSSTLLEKSFLDLCLSQKGQLLRGLPRIYRRDQPLQSHIKKEFTDLNALKKLALEGASLKSYDRVDLPQGAKICLFTYMISDGWGDFMAMQEAYKILKRRFPQASIQSVLCIPAHQLPMLPESLDRHLIPIPYEKECRPTSFPEAAIEALRSSQVIVSLPTFYPAMDKLQKFLISPQHNPPHLISIGQYGFLESEWFHPKSGNYSMGLHFLEKGIFIRETLPKGSFLELKNKNLLQMLFATETVTEQHVATYLSSHQFYLAYLLSPIGGAIYLHALLSSQKKNKASIDICTPDLGWFVEYVNLQKRQGKEILEGNFGLEKVEIHFQGHVHTQVIGSQGKTLRILCPGTLSNADFRNLMSASGEFVAVRGDQSFSEAVSAGKLFFYDGAPHARYFIKDLLALAENRLGQNKGAIQLFRAMGQAFLHNLPESGEEWVEESFFQEKKPWPQIAESLSLALQMPQTLYGCKQLCQVIRNEYSFNKTLCHLVQRAFGITAQSN